MEPLAPTDVQPNAGGEFDTLAPLPSATQLAAMLYKLPDKAIAFALPKGAKLRSGLGILTKRAGHYDKLPRRNGVRLDVERLLNDDGWIAINDGQPENAVDNSFSKDVAFVSLRCIKTYTAADGRINRAAKSGVDVLV